MAGENTGSTLALTKKVYGEQLERLKFEATILTDKVPLTSKAKKLGDTYLVHVPLTREHGCTYNGTAGSIVTLNDAVNHVGKQAEVPAYEVIWKARIGSRAFEEAAGAGEAAFADATSDVTDSLMTSAELRREHTLLYGQLGLGKVTSCVAGVITITTETWTSALWDSMEGAVLEAWTSQAATATQHNGDLVVTAVDLNAKTITVSGTSSAVVLNDWLYFKGARTSTGWNEAPGFLKLSSNTGSLYGIDAAAYSRWRPNIISSAGLPNFTTLVNGAQKIAGRGVRKLTVDLIIPLEAYPVVNSELTSARKFDSSYSKTKGVQGQEVIEFYTHTGVTTLTPHALVRPENALGMGEMNAMRVGVHDLKFDRGPTGDGDLWHRMEATPSYEIRISSIMGNLLRAPFRTVLFTGISYT